MKVQRKDGVTKPTHLNPKVYKDNHGEYETFGTAIKDDIEDTHIFPIIYMYNGKFIKTSYKVKKELEQEYQRRKYRID